MTDAGSVAQKLNKEYAYLREQYNIEQQHLVSLDEARRQKKNYF